jgi:beta-lactamase regulating signal transducer with metallopeptidase domain
MAWPWLMGLWIAGSACVLGIESLRLARVARAVRRAVPGPLEIARRVARLSRELGLRAIPVITIEGQSSPAIWCAGRPRLLWPADMSTGVTDACLDGLIVHELAHVQRRDHLVGWIELVVGVIWWWNPLFWYVRSALREQAELACDAWVISALPNGRRAYAESLLALSSAAVQGRSPALAAVIGIRANNRRVLERRLVMIMQGRASLRLSVAGLVALAVMALASLPAWATGQQPTTPQPAAQTTTVRPTTAPVPGAAQSATPVPVQSTRPVTAPSPASSAQHAPAHPVAVSTVHPATAAPSRAVTVTPHATPSQATAAHPVVVTPQDPARPVSRQQVPVPAQTSRMIHFSRATDLPADGQELLKKFDADRSAIELEADKKVEARRAEFVKSLQVLQEQYTKAGKLDEAVAIRDYIKAGAGANPLFVRIKR